MDERDAKRQKRKDEKEQKRELKKMLKKERKLEEGKVELPSTSDEVNADHIADVLAKFPLWSKTNILRTCGFSNYWRILARHPVVRDVQLHTSTKRDYTNAKLRAYLVQSRLESYSEPCGCCRSMERPFETNDCIRSSIQDVIGPGGGCASCIWSGKTCEHVPVIKSEPTTGSRMNTPAKEPLTKKDKLAPKTPKTPTAKATSNPKKRKASAVTETIPSTSTTSEKSQDIKLPSRPQQTEQSNTDTRWVRYGGILIPESAGASIEEKRNLIESAIAHLRIELGCGRLKMEALKMNRAKFTKLAMEQGLIQEVSDMEERDRHLTGEKIETVQIVSKTAPGSV